MNSIKVPHLPIENFKASEVEEKLTFNKNEGETFTSDLIGDDREKQTKDIAIILHGMGMEEYFPIFQNENVDLDTFLNLTDQDLQELGIENTNDRDLILKNLKTHQSSHSPITVPENHVEDLKIAKNVQNELILLQNYCAYLDLQLKKQMLTDYRISSKETAALYLKMFIESSLTQAQIMKDFLFNSNKDNHLIGKALKVNNLKLPKHLEEKLTNKKVKKKAIFLKVAVIIGFSSSVVLLGRYFISKR